MNWMLNALRSQMHRLGVAVAITGAAVAVAASVVLAERSESDRPLPPNASVGVVTGVAMPTDGSLPAAAEALKDAAPEAAEAPSTF
jgi:hypothetical protein